MSFFASDPSASEITEFLLLADISTPAPLACSLYLKNDSGRLKMAAQTGLDADSVRLANDEWDVATSRIDGIRAMRKGLPVYLPAITLVEEAERLGYIPPYRESVDSVWILPLRTSSSPFGALLFYMGQIHELPPAPTSVSFEDLQLLLEILYSGKELRSWWSENRNRHRLPVTKRQKKILTLISLGLLNSEIAKELNVSEGTVKLEIRRLLATLNATNRKDAVKRALELEVI